MRRLLVGGALLFSMPASPVCAASADDINKLTTYSTILGRAIACGANTESASVRIGRWMDKQFPPGSADQRTYLPIFVAGVRYAATEQKSGRSPDTCDQVMRAFDGFPWP